MASRCGDGLAAALSGVRVGGTQDRGRLDRPIHEEDARAEEQTHYADFEARVFDRLDDHLADGRELDGFIDALVDRVLRDAFELGPELQALVRDEMRPESLGLARQTRRLDQQVRMISRWWEDTVGTPPFEGAIHAIVLLLQSAELRVAATRDEAERLRLKRGITFLIRATVAQYRDDPTRARLDDSRSNR